MDTENNEIDLIAMRRYLLRRKGPLFPAHDRVSDRGAASRVAKKRARDPKQLDESVAPKSRVAVENGSLVISGGGRLPNGLLAKFVQLAGGNNARILVIPTAMPDPLPAESVLTARFVRLNANVTELKSRTRAAVDSPATLELIRNSTGIWFDGGRQWRLMDIYEDTLAADEMHALLKRGGVIAGSSAGASVQGEFLARGNPLGSQHVFARGYERGLGFIPETIIDQHFSQRNRQPDLLAVVDRHPNLLGIGIDEGTAIIVRKNTATVIGTGNVYLSAPEHRTTTANQGVRKLDLTHKQEPMQNSQFRSFGNREQFNLSR